MGSPSGIGKREREILTAIVETYISTGEPVGSRTLARSNRESLSAASIRNVMADLADAGFLEKSPIVFSAKRAALKPTNAFLSALFVARKPAYATKWTLTSERQQRDKLTWFTPKFTQGAPIETVDEFHALKALSDQIVASQSRFKVDQSDTDGVAAEDSEAF